MKFILLVIFAFQFANFGQTQVTIPLYCDCLREWFEDRAEFFGTENPKKLAKKIFNSWNTIVDDKCIDIGEYKNNIGGSNYCGGYRIAHFIRDFDSTNDDCDADRGEYFCCISKKELKKAIRKIKQNC